jgi:hypothetical protein
MFQKTRFTGLFFIPSSIILMWGQKKFTIITQRNCFPVRVKKSSLQAITQVFPTTIEKEYGSHVLCYELKRENKFLFFLVDRKLCHHQLDSAPVHLAWCGEEAVFIALQSGTALLVHVR